MICIASLFNRKARLWKEGRKNLFDKLRSVAADDTIWVHCASLGEFEQGRPLIEKIKEKYPRYKILLTFFSPSGYEIRKNYPLADAVTYLPLDTRRNAKRFISIVKPTKAYFIKYEFWYFFLKELKKNNIPVYLVSANFRENQIFFRWYGQWYKKILFLFTHIFVQHASSAELLKRHGIAHCSVSGDTRFDRVCEIAARAKEDTAIEVFKQNKSVLIAGSTWPEDEKLLVRLINECANPLRYIIAPHEIHPFHLDALQAALTKRSVRYSQAINQKKIDADVLIIDNIGMLSSLYRYGTIAYIGGGFGKGIHNILEAAVFGMPVLFGPRYHKFNEAIELAQEGGAFPVDNYAELTSRVNLLITHPDQLARAGEIARHYVQKNKGATEKIINSTF